MKIRSSASALLLVSLVLNSCTNQNTEVKVGSSPPTSADTNVKPNSSPPTAATSKLFLFTRNGKYGYIDRTGKIVIPAKLDTPYENSNSVTSERDELISFAQEDHFGNIRYEFAYRLGLYGPKPRVEGDYFHGYKDRRTGKVIIPPQFRHAADRFSDGLAWIMDEQNRVGYIDKQGEIVIPLQYSYSSIQCSHYCSSTAYFGSDFNGGLAKVCLKEDEIEMSSVKAKIDFDRGLAAVYIPKTCGFSVGEATPTSDENDCVRSGYIDTTGKLVFEF